MNDQKTEKSLIKYFLFELRFIYSALIFFRNILICICDIENNIV